MASQNTEQATAKFDYHTAFSRTLGFVTPEELESLRNKTVALAGLGGVGGLHLLTLTRLGIGKFHLADLDTFGIENFNRQAGADLSTVGRPKLDVMIEQARRINPELQITPFPQGVQENNISQFLEGADLYLDGLDYFAFRIRAAVFQHCFEKKIPAVTAGPIGMGAALINFLPGGMSFKEYFDWQDSDTDEVRGLKFLVGLTPSLIQRSYLVDNRYVNMKERRGPSTPMAIDLCAGMAGTEILKILLKRGPVSSAPTSLQFDAFHNRLIRKNMWLGNRNPIQKVKLAIAEQILKRS